MDFPIIGINKFGIGNSSSNLVISSGRDIPWLQDIDYNENNASDVWSDSWQVAYRDVVVLNDDNSIADVFNLSQYNLEIAENYNHLQMLLVITATSDADFDDDDHLTANDIDILFAAINTQTTTPAMDLTGDQIVDNQDISELVVNRIGTTIGDTDLDGDVDITDFNALAIRFDPLGNNVDNRWSDGNFDGDNDIDITDFNALSLHFAPSNVQSTNTVPEPPSFVPFFFAALGATSMIICRQRCTSLSCR